MSGRPEVERVVREVISVILPAADPARVAAATTLKELGADSVDRVEIVVEAMDLLGVVAPMSDFSGLPDLDALVDRLLARRPV